METTKNMTRKNLMVLLVSALFVLTFAVSAVSAFGTIQEVEFDDITVYPTATPVNLANFAGDQIPVEIQFIATADAEDVRMKAWISGESQNIALSERFDVVAGTTYKRTVLLQIPHTLDDDLLEEVRSLNVVVEDRSETADDIEVDFTVQRASYDIEILSVNMQSTVNSGDSLVVDTVVKNRGRQDSDDTFVKVSIPELGLETTTYFGDLTPTDQSDPDKEDAVERRSFLRIPVNAPAGLYTVRIEAYGDDSFTAVERKVLVDGAEENTLIVSSRTTQTFSVGEIAEYDLTFVNRGSQPLVYTIDASSSATELSVRVDDPLIVVPAGSSRTVSIFAEGSQRDDYAFSVTVRSDEGLIIEEQTFVANVMDGSRSGGSTGVNADTTVLLTVILAIVFVVLLVVLIVLLTRKPETKEEFGESYY